MRKILEKTDRMDNSGLVGIGTMVVFVSIVTVSSVAAGVLINTGQSLETQAKATVRETVPDVSTGVKVVSAIGYCNEEGRIESVEMLVRSYPGSQKINLENAVIQETWDTNRGAGTVQRTYVRPGIYENYLESPVDENGLIRTFTVYEIQDINNNGAAALDEEGDMCKVFFYTAGDPGSSDATRITIIPKKGFNTPYEFLIPELSKNERYSTDPKPVEI